MKIFGREIFSGKKERQERRRGERHRTYETLYVDFCHRLEAVIGTAEGMDLSVSGIRFAFPQKFLKGGLLELKLRFPENQGGQKQVEVQGKVVRCYRNREHQRYRTACTFVSMDPKSQEAIESYLAWLKERAKDSVPFRYER